MKTTFIALRLFIVMTLITGVIYPLFVTGVSQAVWPTKANGSLIKKNGEVVGSSLIAQKFEGNKYFWPRPSAADYNASASSGSNKGPINADLKKSYDEGVAKGFSDELIFASASGLDPHISPQTALYQVDRVAKARGLNPTQKSELLELVNLSTEQRDLGFLGEPRVNVLNLNLEIDNRFP